MSDPAPSRRAQGRALRRQSKLSQGELASELGISASYLNLIENDHRPLPEDANRRGVSLYAPLSGDLESTAHRNDNDPR